MISPGPCAPEDAGISLEAIARFAGAIPILGVCLGHQAIAKAFGARIVRAQRLLKENPSPSEEEIRMGISGNICRCTGYQNIVKAIQYAAARINGVEFKEAAE